MFYPGIIIFGVVFITYILVTITYIGYVNYFEYSTGILSCASWMCALISSLCLFWNARHDPNKVSNVKGFVILLFFTIVMAAMFRIGPVGNIAVIYHIFTGNQVTLMTQVTRSNDGYFIHKGCLGELEAFKESTLRNKTLCGISNEDWKNIKHNTPILLIGTESYFGISFERYTILPQNYLVRELKQSVTSSGLIYLNSPDDDLKGRTKRLKYRNFG